MITISHLSKKYGSLEVLKEISCEIKKGEIISIIGPSGTGKSTFLRCLNLLEIPSSGSVVKMVLISFLKEQMCLS